MPGSCGGSATRTLRHKTHSIAAGDEVAVLYGWHPWAARSVRLHEVIQRATGASARCSLVGATTARLQEIPVWMLDPVACRTARATAQPIAALFALAALRALLADATGHAATRGPSSGSTMASPESRGDGHATLSPPTPHVAASIRPRPDKPAGDAVHSAGLVHPAGADSADAGGTPNPSARRARRRCHSGAASPLHGRRR